MPAPLSPVVQALCEAHSPCDSDRHQLCWADVTATLYQLQGGLGVVLTGAYLLYSEKGTARPLKTEPS